MDMEKSNYDYSKIDEFVYKLSRFKIKIKNFYHKLNI